MRIALISHEYPPFVGGGIGTYTAAAADELALAGHEVHVFANGPTADVDAPRLPGLTVHRVPMFGTDYTRPLGQQVLGEDPDRWSYLSREVAADASNAASIVLADAVAALHRTRPIDVVEVPDCMAEAFYLIRRRAAGQDLPPVVVHLHGSTRESYAKAEDPLRLGTPSIRARMVREDYSIEHADGILSPSVANLDRFAELYPGTLPKRRAVVPYYFTLPGQAPLPSAIGEWPYAVLVGRVEPRKGTDRALAAFAEVAVDHPDLRLVLCGGAETWRFDEPFERVVERLVPAPLRSRLILLGRQPRDAAFAVLQRATIVLHPARWDNWPNAVLEAMAAGAPCIVSDAGGQAEMVQHGRSGLVVPPADVSGLATAMRELIARPDRARAFGSAARDRLRELTDREAINRRKLDFFADVVAAERRRTAVATEARRTNVCLVLDADAALRRQVDDTRSRLAEAVRGFDGSWRAIQYGGAAPEDPTWSHSKDLHALLGLATDSADYVVWVLAGARPSSDGLKQLLRLLESEPRPPATTMWLRGSAAASFFPHRADLGWRDVLLGNGSVPAVFAASTSDLAAIRSMRGLTTPAARVAGLLALLAQQRNRRVQHIGDFGGSRSTDPITLDADSQQRAIGFLELHGAIPPHLAALGADPDQSSAIRRPNRLQRLVLLRARLDRHPGLGPVRRR